jgi:hypothetical protein
LIIYFLKTKNVKRKALEKSRGCVRSRFPSRVGGTRDRKATQKPRRIGSVAGFSTNRLNGRQKDYFLERLDAFNGLIFCADSDMLELTCVAKLQLPFFHLVVGSGQAAQYHPEAISRVRLHPLHCSTISRHTPPLYPQPLAVMNPHCMPFRTVVHFIENTSHDGLSNEKGQRERILRPFQK